MWVTTFPSSYQRDFEMIVGMSSFLPTQAMFKPRSPCLPATQFINGSRWTWRTFRDSSHERWTLISPSRAPHITCPLHFLYAPPPTHSLHIPLTMLSTSLPNLDNLLPSPFLHHLCWPHWQWLKPQHLSYAIQPMKDIDISTKDQARDKKGGTRWSYL